MLHGWHDDHVHPDIHTAHSAIHVDQVRKHVYRGYWSLQDLEKVKDKGGRTGHLVAPNWLEQPPMRLLFSGPN